MPFKRLLLFGIALAGLVPTAALASSPRAVPDEPPPGAIYGTVTQSPCPGPQQSWDCSIPVPGVSVVLYDGYQPIAWTTTDKNGNYALSAPAGKYVMKVAQEVFLPDCPPTKVLVSNFVVFRYDVECKSGMYGLSSGPSSSLALGPWLPDDCKFWEICDGVPALAVAPGWPCDGGIESYKYWCAGAA